MAEKTTVARPYAQAVFALAQEQGDLKGWSDSLQLLAQIVSDAEMAVMLNNPSVTDDQLVELFISICGEKLNESGVNLVKVLAEGGRLELLPEISVLYEVERANVEGTITAEVTSATELNDAQKSKIADALKSRFSRDVSLQCEVDETLLGGAIIRAGDVVIDGSVIGKLRKLSTQLIN
jgi:F-type H+-transporting ATPase subunit delta